jgi:putative DNA primase/helicase
LLFAFITDALRARVGFEKIISACLEERHRGHAIHEHCVEKGGRDYVELQINKAQANFYAANGKRIIKVERGKEFVAWRETQRALVEAKCQVFVRGNRLVEPLWRDEPGTETGLPILAMSLVPYNLERMTDQVARNAAEFVRYDARNKRLVAIDPPRGVIETLLERQDWVFPTIAGIINTPTMRPDGSLLTQQGYDQITQLWHKSAADAVLPPIPNAPTKSDAERALELLDDLLSEFPFVGELDKSVAIAGIMTPVLRGAFSVAPLFFIAKPEAGTGASYFVRLVGTIATGQDATPLVASSDPKELQKELSAKAFEGRPILNLNNLTFDLESALLCQMLTEGVVDIRPFGKNTQTVSCDCHSTTAFANGNNIRIIGDLVRRTVTCRMDAKQEQPELRPFAHDPVAMVKKNRGAYLAAVFTIARAYIAAGCPDVSATELAGFDGWSRKVRHPLVWLGRSDPARSMDENRALDPEREELRELIDALAKCFGAAEFTAADVIDWATRGSGDGKLAFPELIAVFTRDGRNISAKAVGKLLMRHRGRVSGGRSIERVESSSHSTGNKYRINWALPPKEEPM